MRNFILEGERENMRERETKNEDFLVLCIHKSNYAML